MRVLVTGLAGFIGFHVATRLAAEGHEVTGVDNLVDYYPVRLKRARLERLGASARFIQADLSDFARTAEIFRDVRPEAVVHLAAQAGVRHSLERPEDYVRANDCGHVSVLEAIRREAPEAHLVYASSSSVYGARDKTPFREDDRADSPASLYAATKRANELASEAYSNLFGMRQAGLRFFTVYGPWGRPDMAYWTFTDAILAGRGIALYDEGRGRRDFTFVDDVVETIVAMVARPVEREGEPHRIYNVGAETPVSVMEFVRTIEQAAGATAKIRLVEAQKGDVPLTAADTTRLRTDYGFAPKIALADGIGRFVCWFRETPEARGLV